MARHVPSPVRKARHETGARNATRRLFPFGPLPDPARLFRNPTSTRAASRCPRRPRCPVGFAARRARSPRGAESGLVGKSYRARLFSGSLSSSRCRLPGYSGCGRRESPSPLFSPILPGISRVIGGAGSPGGGGSAREPLSFAHLRFSIRTSSANTLQCSRAERRTRLSECFNGSRFLRSRGRFSRPSDAFTRGRPSPRNWPFWPFRLLLYPRWSFFFSISAVCTVHDTSLIRCRE